MADSITFRAQGGKVFATHPWPKEATICDGIIGNSHGLVQKVDRMVVISVENGYAMYEETGEPHPLGHRSYALIEDRYDPYTEAKRGAGCGK